MIAVLFVSFLSKKSPSSRFHTTYIIWLQFAIGNFMISKSYKLLKSRIKIVFSEANGITDEDLELEELSMDPESWTPAIHLYYNDDHTVG